MTAVTWLSNRSLRVFSKQFCIKIVKYEDGITGDPLHSRAACAQPCNVNTHSRAHCSPGAQLCEQWVHGCVNNGARLCASARLRRGSPVGMLILGQNDIFCGHNVVNFPVWFLQLLVFKYLVASHVTEPDSLLTEPCAVIKFSYFSSHPHTCML